MIITTVKAVVLLFILSKMFKMFPQLSAILIVVGIVYIMSVVLPPTCRMSHKMNYCVRYSSTDRRFLRLVSIAA